MQRKQKKEAGGRTVVGEPPTPAMLRRIGGVRAFPPPAAGFQPGGEWSQSYRIFACHGYIEENNQTVGRLRLERRALPHGRFRLAVDQTVVHDDGSVHTQQAEAVCRDEALAPLVEWKLTSRHEMADGTSLPDLWAEESGRVEGGKLELRRKGGVWRHTGPVTSDWSLFAGIGRLPFETVSLPAFDMLEGLSLFRPGHRITYRGPYEGSLHWFQQTGHGTLPYDYWLDGAHRLLVVSMLARSYILDPAAEEAMQQRRRQRGARRSNG